MPFNIPWVIALCLVALVPFVYECVASRLASRSFDWSKAFGFGGIALTFFGFAAVALTAIPNGWVIAAALSAVYGVWLVWGAIKRNNVLRDAANFFAAFMTALAGLYVASQAIPELQQALRRVGQPKEVAILDQPQRQQAHSDQDMRKWPREQTVVADEATEVTEEASPTPTPSGTVFPPSQIDRPPFISVMPLTKRSPPERELPPGWSARYLEPKPLPGGRAAAPYLAVEVGEPLPSRAFMPDINQAVAFNSQAFAPNVPAVGDIVQTPLGLARVMPAGAGITIPSAAINPSFAPNIPTFTTPNSSAPTISTPAAPTIKH